MPENVNQRKTPYFNNAREQAKASLEAGPHPRYHTGNRDGPYATDYDGATHMVKWCTGCKHHRVQDCGYYYCRLLGDQSKRDTFDLNGRPGHWPEQFDGSVISTYAQPPDACPYKLDPVDK